MSTQWDTDLVRRSPRLRASLDHMRWIAALTVVVSHSRGLYFVPWEQVSDRNPFLLIFYFFTRMGQEAVVLFFVMSGFLIGGKFLEPTARKPKHFPPYMVARLTRLAIVTIPTIMLCYLLLRTGVAPADGPDCTGLSQFAGNLLFVQDVLVPPMCNNPPLWSLANEGWYYVLFPCVIYAFTAPRYRWLWATGAFAACTMLLAFDTFDDRMVLLYMPIWLVGIAAWHRRFPKLPLFVTVPLLVLAMALARAPLFESVFWLKDYGIGLAATLVLRSTATPPGSVRSPERPFLPRLGALLAGFSFSLYLVHYPVLLALRPLVARLAGSGGGFDPHNAASYAIWIGLISLALVLGYAVSVLTERHTEAARRWVGAALLGRVASARPGKVEHPEEAAQ